MPLSPMLYHRAGYDSAHEDCRADDQDSNCIQRPPDERKFMRNYAGSVMQHAIGTMKRHDNSNWSLGTLHCICQSARKKLLPFGAIDGDSQASTFLNVSEASPRLLIYVIAPKSEHY